MTRFTAAVIVLLLVVIGLLWLSGAAAQAPIVTAFTVVPTTDERVIVRWIASTPATVQRWRAGYAEPLPPLSAPAELRATWIGDVASTPEAQRPDPYPVPRPTLEPEEWPELPQPGQWFDAGTHELLWPPRNEAADWTQFHQPTRDRYRLVGDGVALTAWRWAEFRVYAPMMGG